MRRAGRTLRGAVRPRPAAAAPVPFPSAGGEASASPCAHQLLCDRSMIAVLVGVK